MTASVRVRKEKYRQFMTVTVRVSKRNTVNSEYTATVRVSKRNTVNSEYTVTLRVSKRNTVNL